MKLFVILQDERRVFFIDFLDEKILAKINKVKVDIGDIDPFHFINNNIIVMGGDLRDGIYLFDINERGLIILYESICFLCVRCKKG